MNEKKELYSQSEQEKLKTLEQELLLLEEELPASGGLEEKSKKPLPEKSGGSCTGHLEECSFSSLCFFWSSIR